MAEADPHLKDRLLNDLSSSIDSRQNEPLAESPATPPTVPDHTLLRRIGKGSYGEVWLARNVMGSFRAVKVVLRRAFDSDRPYEREFAGIRRFEPVSRTHPSQLNVLHVGRDDAAGYFYYVMELADPAERRLRDQCSVIGDQSSVTSDQCLGQSPTPNTDNCLLTTSYSPRTLRSELHQRGGLPYDECLAIGTALATALDHLHRNGLVHRDIKPSNIIFVNGIPKLADIGLVAQAEATMSFVGTEGFVPPEGPGTPQADIYSLGKVLYEMSTGRDRQEFPELPTNLIERPAAERAALEELNEVVLRACHTDPKQRYATAAEMHADLALLKSGRSVARMRGLERKLRWVQRVGAIVTAIAALIALGWWWQARQTKVVRELANQKSQLAEEKIRVVEENRGRLARGAIANGVRLLDGGDPAGALLWFAEALSHLTNNPAEESIHRIRIRQTLNQIPHVLQVFPHENAVTASDVSRDGRYLVTGTEWGFLRVWDARTAAPLGPPLFLRVDTMAQTRFTCDGERVFASSLPASGFKEEAGPTNVAVILESRTGKQVLSLPCTDLVRADLSPNDGWLVTADTNHVVYILDARNGEVIAHSEAHSGRIIALSFSNDGRLLGSGSEDGTVRLWHLPDGRPMGSPIPFKGGPFPLTRDGTLLATVEMKVTSAGETNSIVHTWDTASGAEVGPRVELAGECGALWFPPKREGTLFVMTSKHCTLFDSRTHSQLGTLPRVAPKGPIFAVTEDAGRIMFAGEDGVEGVWSMGTGERLVPPCLQGWKLEDVNFSPDSSKLLARTVGGALLAISATPLRHEDALSRLDGAIGEGNPSPARDWQRLSPDRRYLLYVGSDGVVRRVDFEGMRDEPLPENPVAGMRARQVMFDRSGRQGAIYWSGEGTNLVRIWSETNRTTNRFTLPLPAELKGDMFFTPDGGHLVVSCADGIVRTWRTADGTLEHSIAIKAPDLPLSPDGHSALGVAGEGDHLAIFHLGDGSMTIVSWLLRGEITGLCYNPAGDRFAFVGRVPWTRVVSARTGEPLTPPLYHSGGEVRWVDWSPDGKRLVTAGLSSEVKVWDASTGELLLAPLNLGNEPIRSAHWSLDGRFIVACSEENIVRVWDAATGEPVTPLLKHEGYAHARLVMNNRLITLTVPNVLRAWDLTETRLPAEVIADYARLVSGRRFNTAGVTVPVSPSELADLSLSLHARAPELFR